MNENYSKTESILKSVRKIFINDTVNTNVDVREFYHYVENRIIRGRQSVPLDMPLITIDVNDGSQDQTIPTGEYFLMIRCLVNMDTESPYDEVSRMASRVIYLLHNRWKTMNNQYPNEKLRCRMIIKQSNQKNEDEVAKNINRTILFRIIVDDEILVC